MIAADMTVHALVASLLPPYPFWGNAVYYTTVFGLRYLVLAGLAFVAWYGVRGRGSRSGKVQSDRAGSEQILREIAYSVATVVIFGGLSSLILFGYGWVRYTQFYFGIEQYGWTYFWASIALMLLLYDAYFYWSHRLLHTRLLYRRVHLVHHHSTNPTPWTAYAFHPLESIVSMFGAVLLPFVLPLHPTALLIFQSITAVVGVYHHLGYEFLPRGWARHPVGRYVTTSVAHNAHHAAGRHNYGLYFLFWDRACRTIDPVYEARYAAVRKLPVRGAGAPV